MTSIDFRIEIILLSKQVDLKHILYGVHNECHSETYVNLMARSVLYICLTDVFKRVGIVPSYVTGTSAGKLIAAYCDGRLTMKQTVLYLHYLNDELSKNPEMNHGDGNWRR